MGPVPGEEVHPGAKSGIDPHNYFGKEPEWLVEW